jgi:DtxR family transcriptional regulator, Mn-dependent transcriptional regulator
MRGVDIFMVPYGIEDFLKAVYAAAGDKWIETDKIAQKIGIRLSDAQMTAGKLVQMELAEGSKTHDKIRLTRTGIRIACGVNYKYLMIKKFFADFLCVNNEIAEADAHHIEHVISDESLQKIVSLLEYIEDEPADFNSWFNNFKNMICTV